MSLIGRFGKTPAAPAAAGNIIAAPPRRVRISRRLMGSPPERAPTVPYRSSAVLLHHSKPAVDVRFGSLADIAARRRHVRFTPESGHSGSATGPGDVGSVG